VKKYLHNRRYLVSFDTSTLPQHSTDVIVLGSGVAGLRAAIEAARHGRVIVITKDRASESNTDYAQGGVAVAMSKLDSVEDHVRDTLVAGAGLCDEAVVRHVVSEGPRLVRELMEWGAAFDRDDGGFLFTQEGGHSKARILHAHGDATGHEIERALLAKVRSESAVTLLEHAYAIDIITDGGRVCGVLAHVNGRLEVFYAGAVIVATGGACHIYRETTNPATATGDGIAMAYRAGATLSDLEFVQFHPTTIYIAGAERTLISETVRGEGGMLRDRFGVHFMPNYHPQGDLAPRDVVSRSIIRQMALTHDTNVYLDLRHLDKDRILKRFPKLAGLCALFDIDVSTTLIPVRPSAHYFCGGVRVDMTGLAGIDGLYACGEAAASGLHGANRLGSNSLLEGLVYGCAAGKSAGLSAKRARAGVPRITGEPDKAEDAAARIDLQDVENSLRSLVWRQVGIERDSGSLSDAEERIDFWSSYVLDRSFAAPSGWTVQNMLSVAKLLTLSARMRTESRGAHHRLDFPDRDDLNWNRHLIIKRE
jgi:L-aspartate oxidase